MNTTNTVNDKNNSTESFIESLCYDSILSNQKFKINTQNNLHISEHSSTKSRDEIVPLDLINPVPTKKQHLNKPLLMLALSSALASSAFFASAILMGQMWAVSFALVIWVFGMATLVTSYKNRTTSYQYKFVDTGTALFTLSEPASHNDEVTRFVSSLNKKIVDLNIENNRIQEELRIQNNNASSDVSQIVASFNQENSQEESNEKYLEDKKSQYSTHIEFLFNHGIIDEILYKSLNQKVDFKIFESENRFLTETTDNLDQHDLPDNIIKFPANA